MKLPEGFQKLRVGYIPNLSQPGIILAKSTDGEAYEFRRSVKQSPLINSFGEWTQDRAPAFDNAVVAVWNVHSIAPEFPLERVMMVKAGNIPAGYKIDDSGQYWEATPCW